MKKNNLNIVPNIAITRKEVKKALWEFEEKKKVLDDVPNISEIKECREFINAEFEKLKEINDKNTREMYVGLWDFGKSNPGGSSKCRV